MAGGVSPEQQGRRDPRVWRDNQEMRVHKDTGRVYIKLFQLKIRGIATKLLDQYLLLILQNKKNRELFLILAPMKRKSILHTLLASVTILLQVL
jgi:hypothetical protein